MSWDITLTEGQKEVADIGNYTSNVASMYKKAMGKTMSDFHGMVAGDIISEILKGFDRMTTSSIEYVLLEPENGWGNYYGAVEYLHKLVRACKENPAAVVNVY